MSLYIVPIFREVERIEGGASQESREDREVGEGTA